MKELQNENTPIDFILIVEKLVSSNTNVGVSYMTYIICRCHHAIKRDEFEPVSPDKLNSLT
ncbi:MAG: hypothetical protein K0S80_5337 [Neobacillus sp.]|nr:hypothetical protein [Neobacillus sp.]